MDSDGHDVHLVGDRDAKRAFLEPVQVAIAAPRPLREDDERVAVGLCLYDVFVDLSMAARARRTIDLHYPYPPHRSSYDRNLVHLLFRQEPDAVGYCGEHHGYVEIGQMVGDEDVLLVGVDPLAAFDLELDWGNTDESSSPVSDDLVQIPMMWSGESQDDEIGREADGEYEEKRHSDSGPKRREDRASHGASVARPSWPETG